MEKKKVLIISLNQLPIDFWKQYINLGNTNYWHFNSYRDALNNVTTIWPDIIIVDGYFTKEPIESCINNVIKKNTHSKIFCITPEDNLKTKFIPLNNQLVYSKLTMGLVKEMNNIINSRDGQQRNIQTA